MRKLLLFLMLFVLGMGVGNCAHSQGQPPASAGGAADCGEAPGDPECCAKNPDEPECNQILDPLIIEREPDYAG